MGADIFFYKQDSEGKIKNFHYDDNIMQIDMIILNDIIEVMGFPELPAVHLDCRLEQCMCYPEIMTQEDKQDIEDSFKHLKEARSQWTSERLLEFSRLNIQSIIDNVEARAGEINPYNFSGFGKDELEWCAHCLLIFLQMYDNKCMYRNDCE